MKRTAIQWAAGLAWATAAISSAASAHAIAAIQGGTGYTYASCSTSYSSNPNPTCSGGPYLPYQQTIKFIASPCNSGACAGEAVAFVEAVYPAGRKTASYWGSMCYPSLLFGYTLGTCAC